LPKITPRRFNPEGKSWLPVIYFYDDDHRESQCTVVTETHGPMTGKRVVRGREAECRRLALAS
jgi:putative hydrolase